MRHLRQRTSSRCFRGVCRVRRLSWNDTTACLKRWRNWSGWKIKASSLYVYRSTRKHLQRFILHQFHSSDIAFGQVGDDFLSQLEHYVKGVLGLSQGSCRRIALYSKKILRLAYQEGLIDRLLFETVEIERGENRVPRALNKVSLEKLRALTFDTHESALETARNLFLFSCFTGVAYCDMVTLGREHLFTDDEGAWWLKFRRQKTDTLCRVKLLPEAVRLIERYQNQRNESRSLRPLPIRLILFSSRLCNFRRASLFPFRLTA